MTAKESAVPQRKPKGIRARGRASWEVRYRGPRNDGRWGDCRETVRGSLKEAIAFKKDKDLEARIHKIGIRTMMRPAVSKARVSEYLLDPLERHWRDVAQIKGLRQSLVHLAPVRAYFGGTLVLSVTSEAIGKAIEAWKAEGKKGKKNSTINRRLEVLGRAFNLAIAEKRLGPDQRPAIPKLPERNARQGFLDAATFEAIVGKIRDSATIDFLNFFYRTGMRPGEIASLTFSNLDRSGERWVLRLAAKDAKTGLPRMIALSGKLREIIERRLAARQFGCDLVFHRRGKRMTSDSILNRWSRARGKAGVERNFVPYDLRRTAIRNMVRAGVDPTVAMRISGHTTDSTFRRYDITSEDDVFNALERTERYVASAQPVARDAEKVAPFGLPESSKARETRAK